MKDWGHGEELLHTLPFTILPIIQVGYDVEDIDDHRSYEEIYYHTLDEGEE